MPNIMLLTLYLPCALIALNSVIITAVIIRLKKTQSAESKVAQNQLVVIQERLQHLIHERSLLDNLLKAQQTEQQQIRQAFDQHQINALKMLQDSLQKGMSDVRHQVSESIDKLTNTTRSRLDDIGQQVDRKLSEGFEKTNATFNNVVERLAKIDEAQKKITELSTNVVNLQNILADKRSRGAFGEVQLNALIRNMLPEKHFAIQHKLSNNTRVDCILFLPEPTGNIAIDAKFPLESYQKICDAKINSQEMQKLKARFRQDIKKHIKDIADKYIIPSETSDGAVMFIPAEAIFAEIHAQFPELVEEAHKLRVWLVSPTTLMAILTTARAVLKDAATRKQVHIIQEHLVALSKDFSRFQQRMDNLARHIHQAHSDIEQVHKSSKKISGRFSKIEEVELSEQPTTSLLVEN